MVYESKLLDSLNWAGLSYAKLQAVIWGSDEEFSKGARMTQICGDEGLEKFICLLGVLKHLANVEAVDYKNI